MQSSPVNPSAQVQVPAAASHLPLAGPPQALAHASAAATPPGAAPPLSAWRDLTSAAWHWVSSRRSEEREDQSRSPVRRRSTKHLESCDRYNLPLGAKLVRVLRKIRMPIRMFVNTSVSKKF